MADERRVRECETLLENLKAVDDSINKREADLSAINREIAMTEGEISAAENVLQRIIEQVARVAGSAAGCALGDKRDCINLAIELANDQAEKEAEIQQFNDKLRRQEAERDRLASEIADAQYDLSRIESAMSANRCSELPIY